MTERTHHVETTAVHAGDVHPRVDGAVVPPIFQSATFEYPGGDGRADLKYIRLTNTITHRVAEDAVASLESAEAALVAGSGMAAITAALLSVLRAGDHLLAQGGLYGGTHGFLHEELPAMGIAFDLVDGRDPASWERALKPNTRAIYVESLTNPLLEVGDLDAVPAFARAHGLVSLIDNTFASPVNFRPLEHGFDLSIHSATKYLNGHSDIVAGVVAGRAPLVEAARRKLVHLGGSLDPHAAFLLHRGLKTLPLRVGRQNENALAVARFLDGHPAVSRVHYPGLAGHPDHARAAALFSGFGGMVSFELTGGLEAAERFLSRLRLAIVAPSLGGVETLVTRPAATSHHGLSPEQRRRAGIADGLIRLSVGIEHVDDLRADLEQALAG